MRLAEPAPVGTAPHRGPWLAVGSVCIGAFMGQLDASIAALALPAVGTAFHTSVEASQWVALSYLITLVLLVAPVGRISDTLGRKAVYLIGFAAFTLASIWCAMSASLVSLVLSRVVQGASAAMLQANSVALVRTSVETPQVRTALGIQAGAQAAGLALGPAVGGLLLSFGNWHWLFWVNVPTGLIGLVVAWLFLPRTAAVSAHWSGGVGLLGVPEFRRPLGAGLIAYAAFFGILYGVPLWLQSIGHGGPGRTGVQLAVLPLGLVIVAPFAGRIALRSAGRASGLGLAVTAAALIALAAGNRAGWSLTAELFLAGVGLGLFTPANNATLMLTAPSAVAGRASGLINLTRGLGTAAGVALTTAAASAFGQPLAIRVAAAGLAALMLLAISLARD